MYFAHISHLRSSFEPWGDLLNLHLLANYNINIFNHPHFILCQHILIHFSTHQYLSYFIKLKHKYHNPFFKLFLEYLINVQND